MVRFLFVLTIIFGLSSCSVEPNPITYGKDECAFCMMKIMDARFGAEAVTDKGKIHKFDSAECMFQYLKTKGKDKQYSHLLVTYINQPNILQNGKNSHFVISENIPSPMGGNLSSYASLAEANSEVKEHGGNVFTWIEMMNESYKK